jgi:ankyrin repeat protein
MKRLNTYILYALAMCLSLLTAACHPPEHGRNDAVAPVAVSDEEFLELCTEGSYEEVQAAILGGANVNWNKDGFTPLMLAAKDNDDPKVIKALIKAGANVNTEFMSGETALRFAAGHSKNPEVITALVKAGADVNGRTMPDWEAKETPLMVAAASNPNPEISIAMIKLGADINMSNKKGVTPLMMAAMFNKNPEVITALINAGADVNGRSNRGMTPLMFAVGRNFDASPEIIMILLRAGANPNAKDEDGELAVNHTGSAGIQNTEAFLRLLWASASANKNGNIITLCETGDLDKIQAALQNDSDAAEAYIYFGMTPLMCAARNNKDPKVITKLIKAGEDVNEQNDYGWTPLMFAAENNNNPEIIRTLVKAGADVNARNSHNKTALLIAASGWNSNSDVIEALLDMKSDPNATAEDDERRAIDFIKENKKLVNTKAHKRLKRVSEAMSDAEFMELCAQGNPKEVLAAIHSGANIHARDMDNKTPLMYAVIKTGNPETVAALLEAGADVNAHDNWDNTALLFALDKPLVLDMLLKHGVNINENIGCGNGTAVMYAASSHNSEVVMKLIKAGADVNARRNDSWKETALTWAAESSNDPKTITALIQAGADITIKNSEGDSPLAIAAKNNKYPEIITALLQGGADVNEQKSKTSVNSNSFTPLMHAVYSNENPEVMATLIRAGANINAKDENGMTPLMIAAESENLEKVTVLLHSGVGVDEQNKEGKTALIIAAQRNSHPEITKILLDAGAKKNIKDKNGLRAIDYAKKNEKLANTEALKKLHELTK